MHKCFVTAIICLLPSLAFAAPSISGAVFNNLTTVTISGSAFGAKAQAAPVYWNNLESVSAGSGLPGWTTVNQPGGVVTTADKYAGSKSLYFALKDTNATPGWNQIWKDMGASTQWYFYLKNKFVKNDTNTRFQWKSWRISGSVDGYGANFDADKSIMLNDWWWQSSGWFNTAALAVWTATGDAELSKNSYSQSSPLVSDMVLFNQWQTFENYAKMSSTVVAPFDGLMKTWRNGTTVLDTTQGWSKVLSGEAVGSGTGGIQTHDTLSASWRYMLIGQSTSTGVNLDINGQLTNHSDCDIYYDDIYIDNTQARVMLGDQNTFAASTHREIQPATTWADGSIRIKFNTGSFTTGQTAYLYVIDADGAVSTASDPITITDGSADITKPTTSTNKPSARYSKTETVTLECADDVACTAIKFCYGVGCTPTTTYSTPFPVLKNLASQTYCTSSTDGANNEVPKCYTVKKQRRK